MPTKPTNPLADVAQDAMLRFSKAVKELEVGDRVTYDGRPGTVQGVGCEHCSSVVVKDDDGREFQPGSQWKLKAYEAEDDLSEPQAAELAAKHASAERLMKDSRGVSQMIYNPEA